MVAISYLNRLGLDTAADERAIKRAYARELKQIDQEADAAGFQLLREAYEMALQWVRHQPAVVPGIDTGSRDVSAPAPPAIEAAPSTDAETGDSPQQLSQAVFDDFLILAGEMAAQGRGRDSQLWRKHLQRCANDERLLNLTAGAYFEFRIARLLLDGWRNGHEGLFVAARQVFSWEKDRRRLIEFGQVGAWMNQAIDECEMFSHQGSVDCSGQSDAVTRVREPAAPSRRELLKHAPHLRNMLARFPAWTSIIASRERIEEWLALERAVPAWRRRLRLVRPAAHAEKGGGGLWWKVILFVFVLRAAFSMVTPVPAPAPPAWMPQQQERQFDQFSQKEKDAEALYRQAAGKLYMPPGTRSLDPQLLQAQLAQPAPIKPAPIRPPGRRLTDAELDAIFNRVQFDWPQDSQDNYKIEFSVELDERGAIAKLSRTVSSGLPLLDQKVEQAIRASAPFDAQIGRRFKLSGSWRRAPAKETPAPAPTTAPAAAAAEATP